MENNQRNSRKRLNSLILLVAFTAVMLIVSTYAWFSTQKNVQINGLTGDVKVAEGMQISLDAKSWASTIDLSKMDIVTNAYNNVTGTDNSTYTNTNLKVSELQPVSTVGLDRDVTDLVMYRGTNTEGIILKDIAAVKSSVDVDNGGQNDTSKPDYPGYFAFDVFIQNSGLTSNDTQGTTVESLQLGGNSSVTVKASGGNASTGLQNTPRVAFAKFSGTAPITGSDATIDDDKRILPLTNATTSKITDVAIWEPNADKHVSNIVGANNLLKLNDTDLAKWPLADEKDATTGIIEFADGEKVPTYGLTSTSTSASSGIANIYDWTGAEDTAVADGYLALQNVVQTASGNTKVHYLKSTKLINNDGGAAADDIVDFEILKNTVSKIRVYIWLEGQDVDTTNYASHGGGITVNIELLKGTTDDSLLGNASAPTANNSAYVAGS